MARVVVLLRFVAYYMSLSLSTPHVPAPAFGYRSRNNKFMPSFCRKRQTGRTVFCRTALRVLVAFLSNASARWGLGNGAVIVVRRTAGGSRRPFFRGDMPRTSCRVNEQWRLSLQISELETDRCVSTARFHVTDSSWPRLLPRLIRELPPRSAGPCRDRTAALPTSRSPRRQWSFRSRWWPSAPCP